MFPVFTLSRLFITHEQAGCGDDDGGVDPRDGLLQDPQLTQSVVPDTMVVVQPCLFYGKRFFCVLETNYSKMHHPFMSCFCFSLRKIRKWISNMYSVVVARIIEILQLI
jgi:hypothetical protein